MMEIFERSHQWSKRELVIWGVLSIPWVWPVFFQPLFWDDWVNVSNKSLYEQSQHFLFGGGKSFISPLLFMAIKPTGPWLAHLICFITMIYVSRLIGEIASSSPLRLNHKNTTWIAFALPIFEARFSISVIEYAICFLFLLFAWRLYLRENEPKLRVVVAACLFISISMPSVVILIPLIIANRVVQIHGRFNLGKFIKMTAFSPEIYFPIVIYAVLFKVVLNSSDKYKFSIGGTSAWLKLLAATSVILIVFLLIHKKSGGSNSFRTSIVYAIALVQIGLFPYFAIGYNPLRSFLPHLWKTEYVQSNGTKSGLMALAMFLLGCIAEMWFNKHRLNRHLVVGLAIASLLSAVFAVIGPLDWDSRLWILTIPGLAILFSAFNSSSISLQKIPFGIIGILFIASTSISLEFFLDFQKQNAFQGSVEVIQDSSYKFELDENNALVVYVDRDSYTSKYAARDRFYRQYDFSGPISKVTGIPYLNISIQFDISELPDDRYCLSKPKINVLIPVIKNKSIASFLMVERPEIDMRYYFGLDPRCL